MKIFPTLYDKASTGKIKQWTISVLKDDTKYYISKTYGQKDGKMQTTPADYITGKHIGKSNETSSEEQALLEAESQWTKKKKKGYVESLEDAEAGKVDTSIIKGGVKPQLAEKYSEKGDKITYPAYVQPKLDGVRCTGDVTLGTLWSRTRKPIISLPHIEKYVKAYKPISDETFLDGELYNHEYKDRFEEIVSLVRPQYVKDDHEKVQYHIYDLVSATLSFEERMTILMTLKSNDVVKIVETIKVNNEDELMEAFGHFISEGYEGAMVRNAEGIYEHKRSVNLQKIKTFDEAEFEIIDVYEGRGRMAGKAVFTCKTDNGDEFNAKLKGSLDTLTEIFNKKDTYIGKQLTVQFQGYTNGNVPRFPIGKVVRDYE